MTRPMIRIHDISADEIIDREMNDEEFASYQESMEAKEAEQTAQEAAAAERQSILDRLGITADEAKLLLN